MKYIHIIFLHVSFFVLPLEANYTAVLTVVDEGNGFNDIRFKGAFSNWDVVQGYDDGTNGDTIAGDGIWTVLLESLSGPDSYEWGAIDTDNGDGTTCDACNGSDGWGTWLLDIIGDPNQEFFIDVNGYISGSTSILIPYQGGEITKTILFSVDMTEWLNEEDSGGLNIFSVSRGDQMQVRGGFNAWGCEDPSNCIMTRTPGTNIFTLATNITGFPLTEMEYKYYLDLSSSSVEYLENTYGELYDGIGWEDSPRFGGANRIFTLGLEDDENLVELGLEGYYDLPEGGVIPIGQEIMITFSVDMLGAIDQGFNPEEDTVYISIQDRWLAYLQGLEDGYKTNAFYNGDGIYSVNQLFIGPFPWHMLYTWGFYDVSLAAYVQEGGGFTFGRSRVRYQHADIENDCQWNDYTFPVDAWQFEPPLLVEDFNPEIICTALEIDKNFSPQKFILRNNFPNPFNPSTTIEFTLLHDAHLELTIYDALGRTVKNLINEKRFSGKSSIQWNARDNHGQKVSSGIYFVAINAGDFKKMNKMIFLK